MPKIPQDDEAQQSDRLILSACQEDFPIHELTLD